MRQSRRAMTGFSCPGENSETEDEKEQRRQRELIAKHRQSTGTEEAPDGFYADNGGENGSRRRRVAGAEGSGRNGRSGAYAGGVGSDGPRDSGGGHG